VVTVLTAKVERIDLTKVRNVQSGSYIMMDHCTAQAKVTFSV
ncbi:unnamed protein product, partial [marine sediment metagenome]